MHGGPPSRGNDVPRSMMSGGGPEVQTRLLGPAPSYPSGRFPTGAR